MAALVLALLMYQAYSEKTKITLGTGQSFSYEIKDKTLTGLLIWKDAAAAVGKYFAIALNAKTFEGKDTDVIVCGNIAAAPSASPAVVAETKIYDAMVGTTVKIFAKDATQDVTAVSGKVTWTAGDLSCEFTRLLDPADDKDYTIVQGTAFDIAYGNGAVGTAIDTWLISTLDGTKSITIGTAASTSNTDSLGNLQLVGKLSLAVAAGALLS